MTVLEFKSLGVVLGLAAILLGWTKGGMLKNKWELCSDQEVRQKTGFHKYTSELCYEKQHLCVFKIILLKTILI